MNERALRRRIDDWLDAELDAQLDTELDAERGARTGVQGDTPIAVASDGDPRPEHTRDQVRAAIALGRRTRERDRNRTAGLVMVAASILIGAVLLLSGRRGSRHVGDPRCLGEHHRRRVVQPWVAQPWVDDRRPPPGSGRGPRALGVVRAH